MAKDFKINLFNNKPSKIASISSNRSKVIIYQSELDYLSKCILESPNIETGGNMFGMSTPFGIPIVYYVVGPGPNAIHNVTHFRQDFKFLDENADFLVEEHALHHIGSWHSHHSLGLTQPSQGDSVSTLEGMRECGLNSFMLIIGNCNNGKSSIRPYRYFSDRRCELLRWVVLPGMSPIRNVYDSIHTDMVYAPNGEARMEQLDTGNLTNEDNTTQAKITYPQGYWLNDLKNKTEFAAIIHFLKSKFENVRIFQKEDSTVEVQFVDDIYLFKIHFDKDFPRSAPKLYAEREKNFKFNAAQAWNCEGSIVKTFIKFIETIEL